jgi:predicted PurR-regulated permease PerM
VASVAPRQPYNWTFWRVVWATLVLVSVGLSFGLLYRFHQVIFSLFIAIVLGTMLRPVVAWLQRRGIPGVAGVILIYLVLLGLVVGFVLLLFPLLLEQATSIIADFPAYYQSLRDWAAGLRGPLVGQLSELLPATLSLPGVGQQTGQDVIAAAGQVLGFVGSASTVLFTAAVILLLAYHWTLSGPRTIHGLLQLLPSARRETISELVAAMETKVGAYVAGQGILMLVIGGMALVAYWLIGLPYILVLAVVAGLMEAVPIIGPLLGAIPAALVALSLGPDKVGWVIVATLAIQQIENSLLVPRVMRKAVGVNPFVTLLALFSFSSLLGIAGALMAIPIAAMIQILLDRLVFHPEAREADLSADRGLAGRLRYEAQDLARDLRKQARHGTDGTDERVKQTDQVMDEIEALAIDLDKLLASASSAGDK